MFLNCLAPCATAGVAASVALATATVAPTTFRNFLRSLAIFSSLRICRHQYFRRLLSGMRPRNGRASKRHELPPPHPITSPAPPRPASVCLPLDVPRGKDAPDIVRCPLEFRLRRLNGRGAETLEGPSLTQSGTQSPSMDHVFPRVGS